MGEAIASLQTLHALLTPSGMISVRERTGQNCDPQHVMQTHVCLHAKIISCLDMGGEARVEPATGV